MKYTLIFLLICAVFTGFSQTRFVETTERFQNNEKVYTINHNGITVGEWWPIKLGIKLITNESYPGLFRGSALDQILESNKKVLAIAPDGMTVSRVSNIVEGDYIIDGKRYGSGFYPNYGIIVLNKRGQSIMFTHKLEWEGQMDVLFASKEGDRESSVFFLPSIKRGKNENRSGSGVHRALVRRETHEGEQLGIVILNQILNYNDIIKLFEGLDNHSRGGAKTTHIYYLDGGPQYGQVAKKTNGKITTIGSRDPSKVTNYLIVY